jgi:carbamoyl-phosphate synthase large subunit
MLRFSWLPWQQIKKNMYNIVVTGVGSIIGYGIIDGLRKSGLPVHITGIDIYEDAYGGFCSDRFVQGVRADDPGFIDFINNLTDQYNIDLIIPGIEPDLYKLWSSRDQLKTRVVFGNELCMQLAKDKLFTFRHLQSYDISLIPTLHDVPFDQCAAELGIPFLLKPILSSASKGIEQISTAEEFDFFTRRNKGQCIYQRIVGTMEEEYTSSVFGDGQGGYFDSIILKRKLSGEGSTNRAMRVEDGMIQDYITRLCRILKPVGPLNIQLRKENGIVYLLEINSRVSSSCSIRTMMGYNEPEMCIRYFLLQESIKPGTRTASRAVRYIADFKIA